MRWVRSGALRTALKVAALALVAATIWTGYYQISFVRCMRTKNAATCEPWMPLERWVCDHELPQTWLMGGCKRLAARHFLGLGIPKDVSKASSFWRRDCVSPWAFRNDGSCTLAWGHYLDAYLTPHYVLGWSGRFEGPEYAPHWGRRSDDVLADANAACRDKLLPRRAMVLDWCAELPDVVAIRNDARASAPELVRRCNAGNGDACHFAGVVQVFGIGVERNLKNGKRLLERGCEKRSTLACKDLKSKTLALLEAAVVSHAGENP